MGVVLRGLTRDDFGMLSDWLRDPLVHEWWHDDPEPAAIERQYGPSIDGSDPAVLRIGELAATPVGFVQWYRLADEPEYASEIAASLPVPDDAWSLDYLVGSAPHRNRGVGTALVRAAVAAIGARPIIVPVHAENIASEAVFRKAGFVLAAEADLEPDNPAHSRAHLVFARMPSG